jgi:predicted transcriptional regulator
MATLLEMAAEIVSSHASVTSMSTEELLLEIQKVHAALKGIEAGTEEVVPAAEEAKPSVTVKEAFKKNEVICMVCGKGGFKTLARHLKQAHGLKPGEYKKQFGIPSKQPLAARSFSQARREMAQERGLSDVLAKARATRAAKLLAQKAIPEKPLKQVKKKAAPKAKKQTT